jgi:ribosomal protein S18 acetylase RimI-like enzyme
MKVPAITLREAIEADVEALHRLIVAIAEHHDQREYVLVTVDDLRRDGFGPVPKFGAVLAEVDGVLVGYATYTWNYGIWLGSAYMSVDDVYVSSSHRSLGIGEALMHQLQQVCAERDLHRMKWEVEPDNVDVIRFYERLGPGCVPRVSSIGKPDRATARGVNCAASNRSAPNP